MAFGLLAPSQTWDLHRLEHIHIPAGLTYSSAEIPLKERSMRRVDPLVPRHGKDRVQIILCQ